MENIKTIVFDEMCYVNDIYSERNSIKRPKHK